MIRRSTRPLSVQEIVPVPAGQGVVVGPADQEVVAVLAIQLPAAEVDELFAQTFATPGYQLHIDLDAQSVTRPDRKVLYFDIDAFRKYCLLNGLKVAGPAHPALLSASETLSYGALEQRVSQFAVGLRELGVCPGDRVGMLMLDTPDIVATHLATMAVGAIAARSRAAPTPRSLSRFLALSGRWLW